MRFLLAACLVAGLSSGVRAEEEAPAEITDPALLNQLNQAFPEDEEGTPGKDQPFEVPEDSPLSEAELQRLRDLGITVENGRLIFNNQELTNAMAFHYLGVASRQLLGNLRQRYGQNLAWTRLTPEEQREVTNIFWNRLYLLPETDQTMVRGLLRGRLPSSMQLPTGTRPFGARLDDLRTVISPNSPYLQGPPTTTPSPSQTPPSPNLTAQQQQQQQAPQNPQQNPQQNGRPGCRFGGGGNQQNQEEEPQQEAAQQEAAVVGGPELWLLAVLLARGRRRRRWPSA